MTDPTLTKLTPRVRYSGGTVVLSPNLTVTGDPLATIFTATVAIAGGFAGDADVLTAPSFAGITASYDAATETLTLSGAEPAEDYQSVLERVAFAAGTGEQTASNFGANPTRTATWTLNDGTSSSPVTTTIALPTAPFDVSGDGISDLLFQNNGAPGIWLWDGSEPITATGLANPGASWRIVTSADVNGDGRADLIWQNSDGTPGIWLMKGPHPFVEAGLTNPGASWHLVAAGDTNGDGNADLIWQNDDGTLGVWLMNGTTPIAEAGIGNPGANWKVVGTADYKNNGDDDILLQNTATGDLMIENMNGTTVTSTVSIAGGGPSWHAVSTGVFAVDTSQFNFEGLIAWQNDNGQPGIWVINGSSEKADFKRGFSNAGPGWELVSIDHFTPDGQPDLLFQNTSGALGMWQLNMSGGPFISADSSFALPDPGPGWQSRNGHPLASASS